MTDTSTKKQKLLGLYKKLSTCRICPISCHRDSGNMSIVPGEGAASAKLMIIGEAPGKDEDILERPFQGMAGKMLDKILEQAIIDRRDVFITNTVKCRPIEQGKKGFKNRPPKDKEIGYCKSWLHQELNIVQPKVVITLGKVPTRLLLKIQKKNFGMKEYMMPTRVDYLNSFWIFPCWHPSYIMRSPSKLVPEAVSIFKEAKRMIDEL